MVILCPCEMWFPACVDGSKKSEVVQISQLLLLVSVRFVAKDNCCCEIDQLVGFSDHKDFL